MGHEINFDFNTVIAVVQEKFLSNSKNKKKINMLTRALLQAGCTSDITEEDDDLLLVDSSIKLASRGNPVILVGQDIC